MRKLVKDRSFYAMMFAITLPMALKELINFGISMMDTFMLGQISDVQISAATQANQPQFIFTLFNFGLASGACVLGSQYWGKKDTEAIRKIIGFVLRISLIVSVVLTVLVQIFPEQIMRVYIDASDPKGAMILPEAVSYLKIVSWGYIIFGLTMTFQNSIRSVEIVNISTVSSIISFVINVILNWIFIFGHFGVEAMGIRGAALATLIARIVDFTITVVYAFFIDKKLKFKIHYIFTRDKLLYDDILKISFPVVLNELMWAIGISCQTAILGQLDPHIIASTSIATVLQQLATIIVMAIANSAGVMIGKKMGQKDVEGAKDSAFTFSIIALILGIIGFMIVFFLRKPFTMLYNIDDATRQITQDMLVITSILVFFIATSSITIVGILRGAGDTTYSLKIEAICLWFVAVPLGLFTGFILKAPILLVYAALKVDEPIKAILATKHSFKDSTFKDVTR